MMFPLIPRLPASSNHTALDRCRRAVKSSTTLVIGSRHRFVQQSANSSYRHHLFFAGTNGYPNYHRFSKRRVTLRAGTRECATGKHGNSCQKPKRVHVPFPTWSVEDLELTSPHNPIPRQEMERLTRLALIDVSGNRSNDNLDTLLLHQDLGNMLHMIQNVTEYRYQQPQGETTIDTRSKRDTSCDASCDASCDNIACSGKIYDSVRGVGAIPLRKRITEDPLHEQDAVQAQEIRATFIQPKSIRRGGGHVYFSIKTMGNR
mmetsp:Transcript_11818/g.33940  ORF Transcript_11818/g.33940 Transcript_11818/m.33940 type:complete len:261 (-) Transcript_11818:216-998(-)